MGAYLPGTVDQAGAYLTADDGSAHQVHSGVSVIHPARGWRDLDFHEIWSYRELLYFLVWKELKVRYKQTVVGVGWAVIQPLFTMMIFTIFFGRFAKLPSEGLPYPIFYFSALLPWTFFANALINVTSAVTENRGIITKVYFPRVLLPLSIVLSGLADLVCGFAVLAGLMAFYGVAFEPRILLVACFVLLAVAAAAGMSLWLTPLNAIYRDVKYVLPFFVQLWMFASPVVYSSSLVPATWRWSYGLNPMVAVIEGFRWAITGHGHLSAAMILASVTTTAALVAGGFMLFTKADEIIADVL